jgi:biotin carboxyl carrier protein
MHWFEIGQGMLAGARPLSYPALDIEKGNFMAQEVLAPLAGNILNVLVEPGAKVQEDDELLVIEALKMENLVYSPYSGTVKEVRVKKGDKVEEDAVLLVIE